MKRVLVRLIGMTVILAASMTQAHAADELGLSVDGLTWTSSIGGPLFDPDIRWVPGDSRTETFFVRNNGGTPGDLAIDVIGLGALLDSGDLHISAQGGGGAWEPRSGAGRHRLLTTPDIGDGDVVDVKVTVSFDATSTNQTQLRADDLAFVITLSESASAEPGEDADGGVDNVSGAYGSGLPGAGAPAVGWIVAVGAILVGVGLALVSRRREGEEAHV